MNDLERATEVAHPQNIPVLEKDFVVDEYQIHQARACGADTVLLIIAILGPIQYTDLYAVATGIGMEPLVEVFDAQELDDRVDTRRTADRRRQQSQPQDA